MSSYYPPSTEPNQAPLLYQVERILQRGQAQGERYYLVKWKGYQESQATWEPQANLLNCQKAINQFENIIKFVSQDKIQDYKQRSRSKKRRRRFKNKSPYPKQLNGRANCQQENKITTRLPRKKSSSIQMPKSQPKQSRQDSKIQILRFEGNNKDKLLLDISSEGDQLEATTAHTVPTKRQPDSLIYEKCDGRGQDKEGSEAKNQRLEEGFDQKLLRKQSVKRQGQDFCYEQVAGGIKIRQRGKSICLGGEVLVQKTAQDERLGSRRQRDENEGDNYEISDNPSKKRKCSMSEQQQKQSAILIKESPKTHPSLNLDLKIKSQFSWANDLNVSKRQTQINPPTLTYHQQVSLRENQNPKTAAVYSHRFQLCQQEYLDAKNQKFHTIKTSNTAISNTNQQSNISQETARLNTLFTHFLDISSPECIQLNRKLLRQLLPKKQVLGLDQNGDFLYCKINTLIKGAEENDGKVQKFWACAFSNKSGEGMVFSGKEKCLYFVRVDDLREDSWKKMFRRFTMLNKQ